MTNTNVINGYTLRISGATKPAAAHRQPIPTEGPTMSLSEKQFDGQAPDRTDRRLTFQQRDGHRAMKRWNVYRVTPGPLWGTTKRKLGTVDAPHQPAALRAAWEKWPAALDPKQTQQGISVELAKRQPHSN